MIARRSFALATCLLGGLGCNAVLGLDATALDPSGVGGGATSSASASTGGGSATTSGSGASSTQATTASSSASSAGGGGEGGGAGGDGGAGGEGGAPPYSPSLCGGSSFDAGLVGDGGFELDGTWGVSGELVLTRPTDGDCEGDHHAHLVSGLGASSLRGSAQHGPLRSGVCVAWSFSARSPDGLESDVEIFLNLEGDVYQPNALTGISGASVFGDAWELFEGRCEPTVPASLVDADIAITFPEERTVELDAVALHVAACDGAPPCHTP